MISINDFAKVDRIVNPIKTYFDEHYGFASKPVVIEGLTDDWRAKAQWTLEFFETRFGDVEAYGERSGNKSDYKLFKVSDYIAYMRASSESKPYYLANCMFHHKTDLANDYVVPDYFKSWTSALPTELGFLLSWIYMGAKNTFSGLHLDIWDTSAWNAVFSGKKLWLFYPPDQADYLYGGGLNPFEPDVDKFPYFARCAPLVCIQNPGEVVFTPSGWWHTVYNLEAGVSLTENYINETNYTNVYDHLKKHRMLAEMEMFDKYLEMIKAEGKPDPVRGMSG